MRFQLIIGHDHIVPTLLGGELFGVPFLTGCITPVWGFSLHRCCCIVASALVLEKYGTIVMSLGSTGYEEHTFCFGKRF
jgi:hypothetical protein